MGWDGDGLENGMMCFIFFPGEKWDGIGILVTPGTVCASLAGADDLGGGGGFEARRSCAARIGDCLFRDL